MYKLLIIVLLYIKNAQIFNLLALRLTVDVIPSSVKHIKFGKNFNQPLTDTIIHNNNIISIILSNKYFKNNTINNQNNIIIGLIKNLDRKEYIIFENKFEISYDEKILLDKYIEEHLTEDKLFGNIILQELIMKVFHPTNLSKSNISKRIGIDVDEILDMY